MRTQALAHVPTLALVLLVAACSAEPAAGPSHSRPDLNSPPTAAPSTPGDTETSVQAADPRCEDAPGRRVRDLPDVVVPAVEIPPVQDADGEVVADAVTLPPQQVEAGCVITYDAPGGCLGAVRITGATIPAMTIPGVVVPETTTPGGQTVPALEIPAVTAASVTSPEVYSPRVCQLRREGRLLTVTRTGVVRRGFARDGVARPGATRPERCDEEGCTAAVEVPPVRLEPVRLTDVDVDPARLESRRIRGSEDLEVVTGQGRVSYVAPGAVLFATESARIRPEAETALRLILRRIRGADPSSPLLVEGHTDDRGSAAYGLTLSRQRAAAAATWLAAHGIERSRITTRGLGERDPAVPNTSAANRARNRRVVITVLAP
jgi:outer membrane protein OmpA-like peptidoglycan-associated protein